MRLHFFNSGHRKFETGLLPCPLLTPPTQAEGSLVVKCKIPAPPLKRKSTKQPDREYGQKVPMGDILSDPEFTVRFSVGGKSF